MLPLSPAIRSLRTFKKSLLDSLFLNRRGAKRFGSRASGYLSVGVSHGAEQVEHRTLLSGPEIVVTGMGIEINNGDTTPQTVDGTDFGTVTQGDSPMAQTFTVRNDGDAVLVLDIDVHVPDGFSYGPPLNPLNSQLSPNESDTFVVQLNTDVAGLKNGQVSIVTNDADENPFQFSIRGNVSAAPPEIVVTNAAEETIPQPNPTIIVGSVEQHQPGPAMTFRVANTGGSDLHVQQPVMPTGFSRIEDLDSIIIPGESDTFTVRLDSMFLGTKTGQIQIGYGNGDLFLINISGTVTPPTEDAYEENDARAHAYHPGVTWDRTWLSNLSGMGFLNDDDWYRIDVHTGSLLVKADLNFQHAAGNIDLELYNDIGIKLDESRTTDDGESLNYVVPSSGTYYLRVFGANQGNTYDLWWNDAVPADNPEIEINVVSGPEIFVGSKYNFGTFDLNEVVAREFTVRNSGGGVLSLNTHLPSNGEFTTSGDFTTELSAGQQTTFSVYLNTSASGSKTTNIAIDTNDSDESTFHFQIEASVVVPGGVDDTYEDNDDLQSAYPFENQEKTWLSSVDGEGIQADEDWYRIYVKPGNERVIAEVQFEHLYGDVDMELYDSEENRIAQSAGIFDNESINVAVFGSGTYYIRVFGDNRRNSYDLWWDDIPVNAPASIEVLNSSRQPIPDGATAAIDFGSVLQGGPGNDFSFVVRNVGGQELTFGAEMTRPAGFGIVDSPACVSGTRRFRHCHSATGK